MSKKLAEGPDALLLDVKAMFFPPSKVNSQKSGSVMTIACDNHCRVAQNSRVRYDVGHFPK